MKSDLNIGVVEEDATINKEKATEKQGVVGDYKDGVCTSDCF